MKINHSPMNEKERLRDLNDYKIMDTPTEKGLDELAEIASAICDTPISLITMIDDKRQWFKSVKGIEGTETLREDSFCQHTLYTPKELLIVENPLQDERFKNNPYVLGDPMIRFYAGAPLETPKGNVLGTLCIIDRKPRKISQNQKNGLQLLAKKVMEYLNTRKQLIEQGEKIELNAQRLKKLTDLAPGSIYQFEITVDGKMSFPFISNGITDLHPILTPELLRNNPEKAFETIHPDDVNSVKENIRASFTTLNNWDIEFRVISDKGTIHWHWAYAKPERKEDGTVVWYGGFQDITGRKEYENALEEISFDISHVLRRPVATMLGLTSMIEEEQLDEEKIKKYSSYIKVVSEEMDSFTKRLNAVYSDKKTKIVSRNKR